MQRLILPFAASNVEMAGGPDPQISIVAWREFKENFDLVLAIHIYWQTWI
jgi:hypothetical protein